MLKRWLWKTLSCTFLLAACSVMPGMAATIQYEANIAWNWPAFGTTATVAAFNTDLGTLNSITIQIQGQAATSMTLLTRQSGVSVSGSVGATESIYLPGHGPGSDPQVVVIAIPVYTLGQETGSNGITLTAGSPWSPNPNPVTAYDTNSGSVNPLYFSLYEHDGPGGTVTMPFLADVIQTVTASGGSLANASIETQAAARVIVSYDYSVPEPVTLVLLGSGLLFMGVLGRKRLCR